MIQKLFAVLRSPFTAFDRWLFAEGDGSTLAALRVVFGILAFVSLAIQGPFLEEFYTDRGLLTVEGLHLWQWEGGNLYLLDGASLSTITAVHFLACAAALAMIFGFFTRFATFAVFFSLIAFHNRNPLILNSGDTLLRLVILYLACASTNTRFSLDSFFGRVQRGQMVMLWPQRLIALQVALVYFTTTWYKFQGQLWRDGTATWYVSQLEELGRFGLPDFLLTPGYAYATTWGTLAIELALCTLVWFKPYRGWVLLGGLILHGSIEIHFNIPLFGLTTVSCYLAFYEGHEIRQFFEKIVAKLRRNVVLDGGERADQPT